MLSRISAKGIIKAAGLPYRDDGMLCRLLHQRAWNEICQGNYAAADQKAGKHPERNLCVPSAEAEPFASNPNPFISLTSLIVDVDAENMKFVPPPVPALSKCAN